MILLFKTAIYSGLTFYDITQSAKTIELEDETIKRKIDKFLEPNKERTIEELIKEALSITSETLEFSRKSASINPNELRTTRKTHCVGYASLSNSIINYGLKKMDKSEYKSTHWRGKIYLLGIELTNKSDDSFFKDHDFVEITNPSENVRLRIDPSLYEFTRIGIMNIKYSK